MPDSGMLLNKAWQQCWICQDVATSVCHSVDTNLKCRVCEVRYLCGGACKAWGGEVSESDLDAQPPDCSRLRENAERLLRAAEDYLKKPDTMSPLPKRRRPR